MTQKMKVSLSSLSNEQLIEFITRGEVLKAKLQEELSKPINLYARKAKGFQNLKMRYARGKQSQEALRKAKEKQSLLASYVSYHQERLKCGCLASSKCSFHSIPID